MIGLPWPCPSFTDLLVAADWFGDRGMPDWETSCRALATEQPNCKIVGSGSGSGSGSG
jgi:hypothetical protein